MRRTDVLVIGAGQAGLAMSRCLGYRGIDHVVLERVEVARSWRTERWDSLRLLTPNWLSRMPAWRYEGPDPDGYMTAAEVADHLVAYARSFDAPVEAPTTVERVTPTDDGFAVATSRGPWRTRAVVVASGAFSSPHVPEIGRLLPGHVQQLPSMRYRRPDALGDGDVLVVGPSASGAQIADELARSGRRVTLAVGEHVRVPRTYRGMDIHWWMDAIGVLDERHDEVDDLARARRVPSLQLVGTPERRSLDINALAAAGVTLTGRFAGVRGRVAQLSGSLAAVTAAADLKLGRLLDAIDAHATAHGLDGELEPPWRPAPTRVPMPPTELDLTPIGTVVWATGSRPTYPWLDPRLLDRKGAIRHDGGVGAHPGLVVLGLPFLRRRKSSFLDGVGPDALELADHLVTHLDEVAAVRR